MIKESNIKSLDILDKMGNILDYTVEKILYSFKEYKVHGLLLKSINNVKDINFIDFNRIINIYDSGIYIYSCDDMISVEEYENEGLDLSEEPIIGYEIHSYEGDIVGIIKDVLIKINTGKILGFIVSEGLFDDLLKGYSFLPIVEGIKFSEDKLLCDKDKLSIVEQNGGFKKILGIYSD